jgi:hypothetical protein
VLFALLVIGGVAYLQLTKTQKSDPLGTTRERPALPEAPPLELTALRLQIQESGTSRPEKRSVAPARAAPTPSNPELSDHPKTAVPRQAEAAIQEYNDTGFLQEAGDYPFYAVKREWNTEKKKYEFYRKGMQGTEIPMRGDARRHFISENQSDYPEPKSGCGPTALLNLFVWYTKFGLLKESITHSNPETYKQLKFKQIDRILLDIQRQSRTRIGGTNTLAGIVAMDELVQQYSTRTNTRLHFEIKRPPLHQQDFTELSRNYRAGILSVRPKDKQSGELLDNHAVLCIQGDRSGMITLANWGEFSHGRIVTRPDGQWFLPSNPDQYELRINNLTTLIPFIPGPE